MHFPSGSIFIRIVENVHQYLIRPLHVVVYRIAIKGIHRPPVLAVYHVISILRDVVHVVYYNIIAAEYKIFYNLLMT